MQDHNDRPPADPSQQEPQMKILHVDSSIMGPNSISRTLTAAIVEQQKMLHPGIATSLPTPRCTSPARIWPHGRDRRRSMPPWPRTSPPAPRCWKSYLPPISS
jgi:hypothetical protein